MNRIRSLPTICGLGLPGRRGASRRMSFNTVERFMILHLYVTGSVLLRLSPQGCGEGAVSYRCDGPPALREGVSQLAHQTCPRAVRDAFHRSRSTWDGVGKLLPRCARVTQRPLTPISLRAAPALMMKADANGGRLRGSGGAPALSLCPPCAHLERRTH